MREVRSGALLSCIFTETMDSEGLISIAVELLISLRPLHWPIMFCLWPKSVIIDSVCTEFRPNSILPI